MRPVLTVSILCFNNLSCTDACLRHLKEYSGSLERLELIITDNGSTDNTRPFLGRCKFPNLKVIKNGLNVGFGPGHNEALKLAAGDFFLALNNDLFIKDRLWIEKVLKPFEDSNVALVGLEGTPRSLKSDGSGYLGNTRDYVEGSFLVGRTEQLLTYGLFSPTIKMFWFEDSDVSLRYQQMGYKIAHINISHQHQHSATLKTVDKSQRDRIAQHNKGIFLNRWSNYLKTRKFSNKILVRFPSVGAGDILAATPVLTSLKRDHPTASIEVESRFPDLFLNNPNVARTIPFRDNGVPSNGYDRVLKLNPDYGQCQLLCKLFEESAATTMNCLGNPEIFLSEAEVEESKKLLAPLAGRPIAICNFLMERTAWRGRSWNLDEAKRLVKMIQAQGVAVVEIGRKIASTKCADLDLVDKTSLRQMFGVISVCDLFVGIDSLPFHVAQAFSKRSYILFGATEPCTRIVDFSTTVPIRRDELSCIGCYHRKVEPGFNRCLTDSESCMNELKAEKVFESIFGDSQVASLRYVLTALRRQWS